MGPEMGFGDPGCACGSCSSAGRLPTSDAWGVTLLSLAELKAGSVHCLLFAHLSFFLNYILV